MKKIGVIINPNSGKDIRRIFSYAQTIGNNEKANLVERMILGAQDLGVQDIFIMADYYNIGSSIKSVLTENGDLKANLNILDFKPKGNEHDTIKASESFMSMNVNCIIVLGGDGTSRLVAKAKPEIPLISISTGTNNVFPKFYEGTIVGMAAAVVCKFGVIDEYISKEKMIEIYLNGKVIDYALIDAAISVNQSIGVRAIEDISSIEELIVTRCHPATIGFSSIIGVNSISRSYDDFGYRVKLNKGSIKLRAPFGAGKMIEMNMEQPVKLNLDQMYVYRAKRKGSIALDGERTILFNTNDT
ncbi:MAG: NAD(+)/NADH kinase, partial [Eubacteriaceae bacterium]